MVSKDFAKQFNARLDAKRATMSRVPLVTQADFAFLCKVGSAANTGASDSQNEGAYDVKNLGRVLKLLEQSAKVTLATSSG